MDGWILWLGEVVWRLVKWPANLRENPKDENFWFRGFGLGALVLGVVTGLLLVWWKPKEFGTLVGLASTYSGADKLLAQGYVGGILILVLGIPMVICGVFVTAIITTLITSFALFIFRWITRGIGEAIVWAMERMGIKLSAVAMGALLGALLGAALGALASRIKLKDLFPAPAPPVEPSPGADEVASSQMTSSQ